MPNHMVDDLQVYLGWYKDNNVYKSKYVLFGTFLKAYSEGTIDRWFNNTLKNLDDALPECETFPRIVIHEIASMLVNAGASPMIIAQRLGHSSTEEVTSRYGHLYPST